jgi:carboxylesterase type B
VYYFTHELTLTQEVMDPLTGRPMGVWHGSELLPVLDYAPLLWGPGEAALGGAMAAAWAAFVATGRPTANWKAFDEISETVVRIDTSADGGVNFTATRGGIRNTECDVWRDLQIPPQKIWGSARLR